MEEEPIRRPFRSLGQLEVAPIAVPKLKIHGGSKRGSAKFARRFAMMTKTYTNRGMVGLLEFTPRVTAEGHSGSGRRGYLREGRIWEGGQEGRCGWSVGGGSEGRNELKGGREGK